MRETRKTSAPFFASCLFYLLARCCCCCCCCACLFRLIVTSSHNQIDSWISILSCYAFIKKLSFYSHEYFVERNNNRFYVQKSKFKINVMFGLMLLQRRTLDFLPEFKMWFRTRTHVPSGPSSFWKSLEMPKCKALLSKHKSRSYHTYLQGFRGAR